MCACMCMYCTFMILMNYKREFLVGVVQAFVIMHAYDLIYLWSYIPPQENCINWQQQNI